MKDAGDLVRVRDGGLINSRDRVIGECECDLSWFRDRW